MILQMNERIVYEGKEYAMATEPFDQYLEEFHPEIQFILRKACLRGYLGKWEISNCKLFLTSLEGRALIPETRRFMPEKKILRQLMKNNHINPDEYNLLLTSINRDCRVEREISMKYFFGGREKVFADWFSGTVQIPKGNIRPYTNVEDGLSFDRLIYFRIRNGYVFKIEHLGNSDPEIFVRKELPSDYE